MTSVADTLLVVAAIFGGALGFVAFWMGICVLLGFVSGWQGLASRHRTPRDEPSSSQSVWGNIGVVSYNGVLHLAATPEGLDMRVMPLFRAGHPPLLLPWTSVRVEKEQDSLMGRLTLVRLGEGGPLLRVRSEAWRRIDPRPRG